MSSRKGCVWLVGAGPGDPGLITVRGREILRRADTVVYDALIDRALLCEVRPGASRILMGKRKGEPSVNQNEINRCLIREAKRGKNVVRLKGGDPLLFGRGVGEVQALRRAGISYQIIPGVSSAWAVPAYAGISLTDRSLSSSVALVTGHEDPRKGTGRVRWRELARGADTLVIFMGGTRLREITRRLTLAGLKTRTPCALLYWGTTPKQRCLYSSLGEVSGEARKLRFKTPALLVVGKVAGARKLGCWWGTRGLSGKKILVTRPRNQSSELTGLLRRKGARVVGAATIRIRPASSTRHMDRAIRQVETFDWIIFTSANGVEAFFRRWRRLHGQKEFPRTVRVAVIGPITQVAARAEGLKVSVVPERYQAEGLLEAFREKRIRLAGKHLLLPRAARVRPQLVRGLRKMGARVLQVEAYRTELDLGGRRTLRALSSNGGADVITFTSSSTVENFLKILGPRKARSLLQRAVTASIGPITSGTLSKLGFGVDVEAQKSTVPDLVRAIEAYYN